MRGDKTCFHIKSACSSADRDGPELEGGDKIGSVMVGGGGFLKWH